MQKRKWSENKEEKRSDGVEIKENNDENMKKKDRWRLQKRNEVKERKITMKKKAAANLYEAHRVSSKCLLSLHGLPSVCSTHWQQEAKRKQKGNAALEKAVTTRGNSVGK